MLAGSTPNLSDMKSGMSSASSLSFEKTAAGDVFAFGIFTDNHHVNIFRSAIRQRRLDVWEQFGRADICVLIKRLAHVNQRLHGDMIWHVGRKAQRP